MEKITSFWFQVFMMHYSYCCNTYYSGKIDSTISKRISLSGLLSPSGSSSSSSFISWKKVGWKWNNNMMKIGATPQKVLGFRPVASSPPRDSVCVAVEPLTEHELIDYLASGCKPKEQWRIGTEHEKIGFEFGSLRPITHDQISDLLNGMAQTFHWDKIMEGEYIIGLKRGMQTITLEAGGQLELSGAPVETLHETCAEINSHLYQVNTISKKIGIGFLGIGYQPKWGLKDIPFMPKKRLDVIKNYLPKKGSLGLEVLLKTSSVQVNLDFSSELDMVKKFRVSLSLQPIVTAMFANSPFSDGKPSGYLSARSHGWTDFDKARTGMLPFVFDDNFGFEQYVKYTLDVPLYLLYRNKKYINCGSGVSFRDFMRGKLPCLPGEFATLSDWENHIATVAPEVGLLYDEVSLQSAADLTKDWTSTERDMLRNSVPKTGLKTPFRSGTVRDVAEDILKLAKDGLQKRGHGESGLLDPLFELVRAGVTPAEKLLELYHGKWSNSVDPVFDEFLY